jgi:hypothetical protein
VAPFHGECQSFFESKTTTDYGIGVKNGLEIVVSCLGDEVSQKTVQRPPNDPTAKGFHTSGIRLIWPILPTIVLRQVS